MTKKQAPSVEDIMAQLRAPQTNRSITERLTDAVVDEVADAGVVVGRLGAAVTNAGSTFQDAYHLENERQLRRRAERIHAAFA